MKTNPFYFGSAAAMLAGCYILSEALHLQPGHLGKLLVLMGVVQVYECLLVGLGLFLVVKKRAAADGLTLLGLECVFLLDATFLGNECAAVDVTTGAVASAVVLALGVLKLLLAWHLVPHLVTRRTAIILGVHAAVVQALPVVIAQAASVRWLSPAILYGLWWLTLALPIARQWLLDELGKSTRARRTFLATLPAVSVLVHLIAVGWVHDIGFYPAFLAPLLLGLALLEWGEQWLYPAIAAVAVLFSLGQQDISLALYTETVSPARLMLFASGVVLIARAWLLGSRWLLALGAAFTLAGILGPKGAERVSSALRESLEWLFRTVVAHMPKDATDWGVVTIALAFLLLALGLRRSLKTNQPEGGR